MNYVKKRKKTIIGILLAYLIILPLSLMKTNYQVITPGIISNIKSYDSFLIDFNNDGNIDVNSGGLDFDYINDSLKDGSLNTTGVYAPYKVSPLRLLVASLFKKNTIREIPISSRHISNEDDRRQGVISIRHSYYTAVINGYKYAKEYLDNNNIIDKTINIDYSINGLYVYNKNKDVDFVKIGDIIISVNGITDIIDISEFFISGTSSYDVNNLTVRYIDYNTKEEKEVLVDRTNKGKGIMFYENIVLNKDNCVPKVDVPDFEKSNSGGPSGGLLNTLYIYSILTGQDIVKNRYIAGTGTMELDGSVGQVGGITQKIYTADNMGVDIFIIPNVDDGSNATEARLANETINNKVNIIYVTSFHDAVNKLLETVGGN